MVLGLVLAALGTGRRDYWVSDSLHMGCQDGDWGLLGLGFLFMAIEMVAAAPPKV